MAIALALVASLLWGVADFAGGTVTRGLPALVVVFTSQVAGLVLVTLVALGSGSWQPTLIVSGWAVAAGVAGAAGLAIFYHALAVGTMGVVSPIAAMGVVVPVVYGLLTGQLPGIWVSLGVVAAIAGVVAASGPERAAGRSTRPALLGIAAAALFGITLVFLARGAEQSAIMTTVGMRTASVVCVGLLCAVIYRTRRRRRTALRRATQRAWLAVIAAGALDVSANLAFAHSSTLGALALVAVLGSLYPAVTVLLARVVHGERLSQVQKAGVLLALAGAALISGWS